MPRKTYRIITMGCQMNERDSETIAGLLEQSGYARMDAEDADIVVVNTCSVRENADNRFFGLLGRVKHIKERNPSAIVAVCGCMMQQAHIVDKISNNYSWVDIVFGTHSISDLPELLEELRKQRNAKPAPLISVPEGRGPGDSEEFMPAKRRDPHRAFVNIMYGCDNFCTYCIVPYTRGRETSRSPESILAEITALARCGTKEVTLLGQNVNSYSGGIGFPELLRRVNDVDGLRRIRFMTSHPKDLSEELALLYGMGGAEKLCPAIHLPVQSGSTRVLERMNRGYTREDYLALIEKLRAANPDITITTDFIVGFQGETEADFRDTIDLIERVRFDSAFTFLYSPRKGTPAADFSDAVPDELAHERFDRMVALLNSISAEKNRAQVGQTHEILVEGDAKTGDGMLCGRTFSGRLVNFPEPKKTPEVRAGEFVRVRITESGTFSFKGEINE